MRARGVAALPPGDVLAQAGRKFGKTMLALAQVEHARHVALSHHSSYQGNRHERRAAARHYRRSAAGMAA